MYIKVFLRTKLLYLVQEEHMEAKVIVCFQVYIINQASILLLLFLSFAELIGLTNYYVVGLYNMMGQLLRIFCDEL